MDISVASFGIAAPERDPATSEVLIGAPEYAIRIS
jgi:hypothetical protein